jgi:hypothetical protein
LLYLQLKLDPTDISYKMIPEVISFPAVEIEIKTLHEPHAVRGKALFREGVESVCDGKRLLVKDSSGFPRASSKRPEVCIAEVLRDDETVGWIVADYLRYGNINLTEKLGNVSVIRILYTLRIVMDQDGRILLIPF